MPTDPTPADQPAATPDTSGPLAGVILDADAGRVTVTVDALDGGARPRAAFGLLPDASPGDPVRVLQDATGAITVIAWEPSA